VSTTDVSICVDRVRIRVADFAGEVGESGLPGEIVLPLHESIQRAPRVCDRMSTFAIGSPFAGVRLTRVDHGKRLLRIR